VAIILRGRFNIKLNDNPIDDKKEDLNNPFENLKIGNEPLTPEMIEKLTLHLDTPDKIMTFRNLLIQMNSEKINTKYVKQKPLKNQ